MLGNIYDTYTSCAQIHRDFTATTHTRHTQACSAHIQAQLSSQRAVLPVNASNPVGPMGTSARQREGVGLGLGQMGAGPQTWALYP